MLFRLGERGRLSANGTLPLQGRPLTLQVVRLFLQNDRALQWPQILTSFCHCFCFPENLPGLSQPITILTCAQYFTVSKVLLQIPLQQGKDCSSHFADEKTEALSDLYNQPDHHWGKPLCHLHTAFPFHFRKPNISPLELYSFRLRHWPSFNSKCLWK